MKHIIHLLNKSIRFHTSNIEIYKYDFISINKFINYSINLLIFVFFDELILKYEIFNKTNSYEKNLNNREN